MKRVCSGTTFERFETNVCALGLMYLHGLSNYGDSVEDEWLIVYILKELSKRFPDLWIKIVDSDGEFLLIEAANALPRWLNPEIADNRVWIHGDKLCIIPLSAAASSKTNSKTAPISRSLTIEESLKTITSTPGVLINSPLIEEEAFYRLRNYPSQVSASLHYSPVTLPRKLAYILHSHPTSIAPAIEAFYLRDPVALKPLQTASKNLIFSPEDLVTVSVRFTKVLFAQLRSQRFSAPLAWKSIITQTSDDEDSSPKDSKYLQSEMGMKLTSGFEMLISDEKNSDNRQVRAIKIVLEDLAEDKSISLPTDDEIAGWKDITRADDEKWLDINFEDFDRELGGSSRDKKSSKTPGAFGPDLPSGFGDAKTQSDLKKMVERFEAFLNDEDAGVDGVELDDMDYDDDDDEDEDEDEDEDLDDDSEEEDKDVSFDENEFAKMMREMMGLPSEDNPNSKASSKPASKRPGAASRIEELDSDEEDSENEAEELKKIMQRIEAELGEEGALNLDPNPEKPAALKNKSHLDKGETTAKEDWEDESDEDINIDFNLAKNLLESFKSQAGMAGPGGNILGMLGMQLPRDEEERMRADGK